MKTQDNTSRQNLRSLLSFFVLFGFCITMHGQNTSDHKEYRGLVLDANSGEPLVSATVSIDNTNISTVTNAEGEFLLKISENQNNNAVRISFLGYNDRQISFSKFGSEVLKLKLEKSITELSEVNIDPRDPLALVRAVMKKKGVNYLDDPTIMTAFYRETIKKRRKYVSLSEAVVDVYKNPYESNKTDLLRLYKARKSANYKKLDTLAVKLQGGPTSTLYIDLIKNPDNILAQDMLEFYEFSFDPSTKINDRYIYVINFKQRASILTPLYYGKLYIDSKTLALNKAVYSLNVENQKEVSEMYVRKKPNGVNVSIERASYDINYRQKNGKWYYSYGNIDLNVKINWKKKLFNSKYKLNIEMAVTDWKKNMNKESIAFKDRLKSTVVLSDKASGFSDPKFWGEYNVIEPEKSIESAIKKIKKQLARKLN